VHIDLWRKLSRANFRPISERFAPKISLPSTWTYIFPSVDSHFECSHFRVGNSDWQLHFEWGNRATVCMRVFIEGYCNRDQDSTYGYSPNCKNHKAFLGCQYLTSWGYNATKIATKIATDIRGGTILSNDKTNLIVQITWPATRHSTYSNRYAGRWWHSL
jgi:hypothetical protein